MTTVIIPLSGITNTTERYREADRRWREYEWWKLDIILASVEPLDYERRIRELTVEMTL